MLRNLFLFIAVVVLGTFTVFAQANTYTGTVDASATVLTVITATQDQALAFGTVLTGAGTTVISPVASPDPPNPTGTTVGAFTITGGVNRNIAITIPGVIVLSKGASKLNVATTAVGANASGGTRTSITTGSAQTRTFSASGNYNMWVGGSLYTGASGTDPIPASQENGAYSGSETLTIEYN